MALSEEQIILIANDAFDTETDLDDETLVNKYGHGVYISRFLDFARAIEAEVRKQDEALVEQMHVALKNCRATGALDDQAHALASTAITAARARLGEKT